MSSSTKEYYAPSLAVGPAVPAAAGIESPTLNPHVPSATNTFEFAEARPVEPQPITAEAEVRLGFIRKIYGTIFLILGSVFVLVMLANFAGDNVTQFLTDNSWVYPTALMTAFASLIVMSCMRHSKKKVFTFWVFLASLTVLLMAIAAVTDTLTLVVAIVGTLGILVALTFWTMQKRFTVSKISSFAVGLSTGILVMFFLSLFTTVGALGTLWSVLWAAAFAGFIVIDTWRVVNMVDEDAPFEAVIQIVTDTLMLFLQLLAIFGGRD